MDYQKWLLILQDFVINGIQFEVLENNDLRFKDEDYDQGTMIINFHVNNSNINLN